MNFLNLLNSSNPAIFSPVKTFAKSIDPPIRSLTPSTYPINPFINPLILSSYFTSCGSEYLQFLSKRLTLLSIATKFPNPNSMLKGSLSSFALVPWNVLTPNSKFSGLPLLSQMMGYLSELLMSTSIAKILPKLINRSMAPASFPLKIRSAFCGPM